MDVSDSLWYGQIIISKGYGLTIQNTATEPAPPPSRHGSYTSQQNIMYPRNEKKHQTSAEIHYKQDQDATIDIISGNSPSAVSLVPPTKYLNEGQKKRVVRVASICYEDPKFEDASFLVLLEGEKEPVWLQYSRLKEYPSGTEAVKQFGSSWNIPK